MRTPPRPREQAEQARMLAHGLGVARRVFLLCTLGIAGAFAAASAVHAWRQGRDTVTVRWTAVLALVVVLAAALIMLESIHVLSPMAVAGFGVVLLVAAIAGAVVLAMSSNAGVTLSPWAMLIVAAAIFAVMYVVAVVASGWVARQPESEGSSSLVRLVWMFLAVAVAISVLLVIATCAVVAFGRAPSRTLGACRNPKAATDSRAALRSSKPLRAATRGMAARYIVSSEKPITSVLASRATWSRTGGRGSSVSLVQPAATSTAAVAHVNPAGAQSQARPRVSAANNSRVPPGNRRRAHTRLANPASAWVKRPGSGSVLTQGESDHAQALHAGVS